MRYAYGMQKLRSVLDLMTSVSTTVLGILAFCSFSSSAFSSNQLPSSSSFPYTDRPIASIAFHAEGDLLAVASGHKVSYCLLNLS